MIGFLLVIVAQTEVLPRLPASSLFAHFAPPGLREVQERNRGAAGARSMAPRAVDLAFRLFTAVTTAAFIVFTTVKWVHKNTAPK